MLKLRDPSSLGEKAYWLSSLSLFFRDSLDGARLGHKLVLEDDLGDVIVEAANLKATNLNQKRSSSFHPINIVDLL